VMPPPLSCYDMLFISNLTVSSQASPPAVAGHILTKYLQCFRVMVLVQHMTDLLSIILSHAQGKVYAMTGNEKPKLRIFSLVFGVLLLVASVRSFIRNFIAVDNRPPVDSPEMAGFIVGSAMAFMLFLGLGLWLSSRGVMSIVNAVKHAEENVGDCGVDIEDHGEETDVARGDK